MRQIGTATGIDAMPISSTIGSLFLTTASGSDWIPDSFRGITCRITPVTTIRTIITLTFSRIIVPRPLVPIRTVTTLAFSRTITLRPIMARRRLMPQSELKLNERATMNYRLLGKSGLRVPEAALGTMTFGDEWGWGSPKDEAQKIYETYREAGGNFLDTANFYTSGTSEKFVGEFIKGD